jgi:cobalt-zinc-cadmium efflux system protein
MINEKNEINNKLSSSAKYRRAMTVTFALTFTYFIVEVIGGIVTNSLALLADAAHMLTDVGGLALALFAMWIAQRPANAEKTYGYYRVEILAALANALVLFLISFYILYEAYRRFQEPPEVASLPMLAVAAVGLGVNLVGIYNLRSGSKESLNVQGAFLEVVSDMLGSVGVIVAGLIMFFTKWYYADPIFSVLIGLFVLPRAWTLMKQSINILLESAPAHINLKLVEEAILSIHGMVAVHDLHVWTITSGMDALSVHIVLTEEDSLEDGQKILDAVNKQLKEKFGIAHTTIQIDGSNQLEKEKMF